MDATVLSLRLARLCHYPICGAYPICGHMRRRTANGPPSLNATYGKSTWTKSAAGFKKTPRYPICGGPYRTCTNAHELLSVNYVLITNVSKQITSCLNLSNREKTIKYHHVINLYPSDRLLFMWFTMPCFIFWMHVKISFLNVTVLKTYLCNIWNVQ